MSDINWIDNELKTVNLKDKRLNNRLAEILKSLGERPHISIPAACGGDCVHESGRTIPQLYQYQAYSRKNAYPDSAENDRHV